MSIRRASRLRSVARGAANPIALVLALSCLVVYAVRWRAAARGPVPSRHQAVSVSAPLHRQLVSTSLFDDPQAQPVPSPASQRRESVPREAVQRAHAAQQPSVSTSPDAAAGAVHAPVPGRTDEEAFPSRLPSAAASTTELSVNGAPLQDSSDGGASAAQPSSDPAAAPGAARNAAGAAPMLAAAAAGAQASILPRPRRRQRNEQDALGRRREQVGAAVALAARAASPAYEVLERVTPQERLRAFEWLFGPKQPEPPQPNLSPAAAAAVAHDPACAAFYRRDPLGPRTVAVVGNGPLSEADARRANGMDLIIRFNRLNNWCAANMSSSRAVSGECQGEAAQSATRCMDLSGEDAH